MFNVQPGTEISVHAAFSSATAKIYYGLKAMHV